MIHSISQVSRKPLLLSIGNLLCYIPLAMMMRAISKGYCSSLSGMSIGCFDILPLYTIGSTIAIVLFFMSSGWLCHGRHGRFLSICIVIPHWHNWIWGICSAFQIISVLWIYAFADIHIALAALIMKAGVLVLAPIADIIAFSRRRKIFWPSWVAMSIGLISVVVASSGSQRAWVTTSCLLDIFVYFASFFIKLIVISKFAKCESTEEMKQTFVEGMIATTVSLLAAVLVMGIAGYCNFGEGACRHVWIGFWETLNRGFITFPLVLGMVSAAGGIFASLVLLDWRENTYCVTIVQLTSVIATIIASVLLSVFYEEPWPNSSQFAGIVLITTAFYFLSLRDRAANR